MDDWDFPEYDEDIPQKDVICKFCGQRGLTWVKTAARWELRGQRGVHVCNKLQVHKSFEIEDAD